MCLETHLKEQESNRNIILKVPIHDLAYSFLKSTNHNFAHLYLSFNYLNVGLLQVVRPRGEQILSHLLLKVAGIGNESCREQTVSSDGGHLVLEGLAGLLPAVPFSRQTLQQGCAAIHLGGESKSSEKMRHDSLN